MKKIRKIKLNQLNENELESKQMNNLKGGYTCNCSCSTGCTCSSYPEGGMSNSMQNAYYFNSQSVNNALSATKSAGTLH